MSVESSDKTSLSLIQGQEDDCMPAFKYKYVERNDGENSLLPDPANVLTLHHVLKQDALSCIAVHQKYTAVGTYKGFVHIIDQNGFINPTVRINCRGQVTCISLTRSGEYVGCCSEDGSLLVRNLTSSKDELNHSYQFPIKALALNPDFSLKANQQCVVGLADQLVLFSKSWFSEKSTVLSQCEDFITCIQWNGRFIACADSMGIRVVDIQLKTLVTVVRTDNDIIPSVLQKASLFWKNEMTLLVAVGRSIMVVLIEATSERTSSNAEHRGQLVQKFKTDFYVAGIVMYGSCMVCLAYYTDSRSDFSTKNGQRCPRLVKMCPVDRVSYTEVSKASIIVTGSENYRITDYQLVYCPDPGDLLSSTPSCESLLYVLSPKNLVDVKPTDEDDHVSWFLNKGRYQEALTYVEQNAAKLSKHKLTDVGKEYLNNLLRLGKYTEAARDLQRCCGQMAAVWEENIMKFFKLKQLRAVLPYIPSSRDFYLSKDLYNTILHHCADNDHEGLLQLSKELPGDLYDVKTLIRLLECRVDTEVHTEQLLESLALMYTQVGTFDRSLEIYLRLKNVGIFSMIRKHASTFSIQGKILQLVEISKVETFSLLLSHVDLMPPAVVINQLKGEVLCEYLDGLNRKYPHLTKRYSDMMVELYSEYHPDQLLVFLNTNNSYDLKKARDTCEKKGLLKCLVYLLERVGNTQKALQLILEQKNIDEALEFCKRINKSDLWEKLVQLSKDDPEHIRKLLMNVGSFINPYSLIRSIPPKMSIPQLRDALVRILSDYRFQISVVESSGVILDNDTFNLIERLERNRNQGLLLMEDSVCETCRKPILVDDSHDAMDFVAFLCLHNYHVDCLESVSLCPVCSSHKQRERSSSINLGN